MDDFLKSEDIQRMQWSACSPDLNPIEHVWVTLGRQLVVLSHPSNSILEWKRVLHNAWNSLRPQLIHSLMAITGKCTVCVPETTTHLINQLNHLLILTSLNKV